MLSPDTETILCFFIIRRASGKHDIFHILKTFQKANLISRNVQAKQNISQEQIPTEIENIKRHFTGGVKQHTNGYELQWDELNLSNIDSREEQIHRIKEWGKLNVFKSDILN